MCVGGERKKENVLYAAKLQKSVKRASKDTVLVILQTDSLEK